MKASMYSLSVPVFRQALANLGAILDKAAAHAEARKIDPAVLLGARLYPDMFALTRQVQLTCDFAKNTAARLAGETPVKIDDTETSFAELKARIAKTLALLDNYKPAQIDGSEERAIEIPVPNRTLHFNGYDFLAKWALPNFFFHEATAYGILRHNGIEVGKMDFLGSVGA
jgi:uncharacterized protein